VALVSREQNLFSDGNPLPQIVKFFAASELLEEVQDRT